MSFAAPPTAEIRPVRLEDAEAIDALRRLPSVLTGTLALASARPDESRRRLERLGPDDHVFVAVVEGTVVGMAGLHVGAGKLRHTASLGMMVHDRFQGRGIGRRLLETLLDLADNALGLVRVELEVMPDNVRAVRLYERCSFEHEGRKRKALFQDGAHRDLLVMARVH